MHHIARIAQQDNDPTLVSLSRQRTAEMAQEDQGLDMTDTVELENGCACCTAGGDLMDSILKLVRCVSEEVSASD